MGVHTYTEIMDLGVLGQHSINVTYTYEDEVVVIVSILITLGLVVDLDEFITGEDRDQLIERIDIENHSDTYGWSDNV